MEIEAVSEGFFMKAKDGADIYIHQWHDVSEPRAAVQVFHGMAEHAGRYQLFAEFLNRNGFVVYADDHRGHGKTAGTVEKVGYIGEDGYNKIIEDENMLTAFIKEKHPGLPVFIFAHSFGSFIGQSYITKYGGDIAGIILSGSAARSRFEVGFGRILTTLDKAVNGEKKQSLLMNAMCFGTYNKNITDSNSAFAWISRDAKEVEKYEKDIYCGTVFTVNYFYYMFKGLKDLNGKGVFNRVPACLPIYLMSGDADPVGSYGKCVQKLYEKYSEVNIKDLKLKLYPGGRHEMLNEINREEVCNDILNWLNIHLK
jgi:Lysophospholipase